MKKLFSILMVALMLGAFTSCNNAGANKDAASKADFNNEFFCFIAYWSEHQNANVARSTRRGANRQGRASAWY